MLIWVRRRNPHTFIKNIVITIVIIIIIKIMTTFILIMIPAADCAPESKLVVINSGDCPTNKKTDSLDNLIGAICHGDG